MPPCIPACSICRGVRFGRKCAGASGNRMRAPLASRAPVCGFTQRIAVLAAGGVFMVVASDGCGGICCEPKVRGLRQRGHARVAAVIASRDFDRVSLQCARTISV